jgi:hypothetical protein
MFDWSTLFVLAEDLATRTADEAAARTAISRAYYACVRLGTERPNAVTDGYDQEELS